MADFDVERIRRDFPALAQKVRGHGLVYLDNAATTQKPKPVIDTLVEFYTTHNANIHRGVHALSERSTQAYEEARKKIQRFINAESHEEIVFVRGTTEGINLVAHSFGRPRIHKGDEIVVSAMEHHSNIVPWQILRDETGANLKVIPVSDEGELDLAAYERLLTERTRLVSVVYVSNSIGTVNPMSLIIQKAHARGIPVLVDGAQAVSHLMVDVQALDCDFFAFSGHKLFGPTGVGVLYAKKAHLAAMPPYQGGGDMISSVTFEKTRYNTLPYKFEAGTPHISGGIGLGSAVDYLERAGMEKIAAYESELLDYATEALGRVEDLRIIGTSRHKASIVSFVLGDIHAHDVGTILDRYGVAVRTGHHCTMPLMERFGVAATVRASFAFYNTRRDVDSLVEALNQVRKVFR
ncbi:MAG: cysteine desulfurase [Candidatus Omnitrophica bacterium]|nr:cysteine desulfurase [Candidatus Omnitrophota bacterium]